jgi:hypothetical protein
MLNFGACIVAFNVSITYRVLVINVLSKNIAYRPQKRKTHTTHLVFSLLLLLKFGSIVISYILIVFVEPILQHVLNPKNIVIL